MRTGCGKRWRMGMILLLAAVAAAQAAQIAADRSTDSTREKALRPKERKQ